MSEDLERLPGSGLIGGKCERHNYGQGWCDRGIGMYTDRLTHHTAMAI